MKRVIAILLCFLMSTHLVYGNNVIDEILSRKEQKTSNTNIDLKDKASPIQFTAFSYFGDTNIERIKANSDSLGQR